MISKDALFELRKKTGAGVLDCKKALEEANGNVEEAIKQIRQKGLDKAASKKEKLTSEGIVFAAVSEDTHKGSIIELKCETDFVSRNEIYRNLTKKIAELSMHYNLNSKEDLMNAHLNNDESVKDALSNSIVAFGENILIGEIFTKESKNFFESYIHSNMKIGVLVEYKGEHKEMAKDIAMHIAAMSPIYLSGSDMNLETLDKIKGGFYENHTKELAGKPKEIVDRIINGKISKFLETSCLLSQKFVKNTDLTVKEYIKDKIEIVSFKRIALGA